MPVLTLLGKRGVTYEQPYKSMAGKEIVYTFSIHKKDILFKYFYNEEYTLNFELKTK